MLDPDAIRERRWLDSHFDHERFGHIETMLTIHERLMLNWLGCNVGDEGCIIDDGSYVIHPDPLKKVQLNLSAVPQRALTLRARQRHGRHARGLGRPSGTGSG